MLFSRSRKLHLVLSVCLVTFLFYLVIYDNPPANYANHDDEYQERGEQERFTQTKTYHRVMQKSHTTTTRETTCTEECATNLARIASLERSCANLNLSAYKNYLNSGRILEHFIHVKSKSRLVYCDMPKIGSTFVKQVFAVLSGFSKSKDPFSVPDSKVHYLPHKNFQKFDLADIFDTLRKSFNFFIVREPYSRLLSAYVDKIYTTNTVFWKTIGKAAIRNTRNSEVGKSCGHDVTFEEFIRFVILSERSGLGRNAHWYPVYYACRPCHVRYDYIGKIETFRKDMKQILSVTNVSSLVDLSNMNRGNDMETIDLTIMRTFSVGDLKSCISMEESLKRAWDVLQIRGVISHDIPIPKEILSNPNITKTQLKKIIEQTREKYPISKEEKRKFKLETLRKAYATVSRSVLEDFRTLYRPDFVLFDYDENPDFIQNRDIGSESKWQPFSL